MKPFTEADYDALADLLEECSALLDLNGAFGVLHAVAVAPSLMPPVGLARAGAGRAWR